jgi:hypothetical protein
MATDAPRQPDAKEAIPKVPPTGLRPRYLRVTRSYLVWCLGMIAWSLLCVVYFIITPKQGGMAVIGLGLCVLLVAMIVLPNFLFGGETWYKRLGWITVLLFLSSVMFLYPLAVIVVGVVGRIEKGQYRWPPYYTDVVHAVLVLLTLALHAWTILLTYRAGRVVHQLAHGDFGTVDVRVGRT